jgi:hypothetical protein
LDVRNKRGADIGSDHYMFMGVLRIKIQKIKRKNINRNKYNLKKLEDTECQKILKTKLREVVSSLRYKIPEGEGDIEEKWEKIKTALQDICKNTLGIENNTKRVWVSDNTWKMIERRKPMKHRICALYAGTRKRKELEKEYAALSKEVNKSVRKDYRAYINNIANEAQIATNQGNIKGTFNSIRCLMNNIQPTMVPIRDKKGNTIIAMEGQIYRWKEYFEEILNTPNPLQKRKHQEDHLKSYQ